MNVHYSNGSTPLFTDTSYILLMRILLALNGTGGGGGGGISGTKQVFSPVPAAPGNGETQGYLAYDAPSGNLLQWDGVNWV